MTCRVCNEPGSEAWRKAWGCDGPGEEPVAHIECPTCWGHGCAQCESGKVEIYECPNRIVNAETRELFDAFAWLEKGIMPATGGFMEQTWVYQKSMNHIRALVGKWEKDQTDDAKRKAKKATAARRR